MVTALGGEIYSVNMLGKEWVEQDRDRGRDRRTETGTEGQRDRGTEG